MYSLFMSTEFNKIDPDKIQIVSIGTKTFSDQKIEGNSAGTLDWLFRLGDLLGPVKKATQDYMTEQILR